VSADIVVPKTCGAKTRRCQCGEPGRMGGHHRRDHDKVTGRCTVAGCACAAFDPRPCNTDKGLRQNGRCRMHRGTAAAGMLAPSYSHGRYSRYAPALGKHEGLLDRYERAKSDAELFEMRDEVALLQSRVEQLLADAEPTAPMWKAARAAYAGMVKANATGDKKALADSVYELGTLLQRGYDASLAWDEVGRQVDRKRKVVESHTRRAVAIGQMLSMEAAMGLVSALGDSVNKHVKDGGTRKQLSMDFMRLLRAHQQPQQQLQQ
jgi:hypothetical protein